MQLYYQKTGLTLLGLVMHACNSSYEKGGGRRITLKTSHRQKHELYPKNLRKRSKPQCCQEKMGGGG
jgi:hypothetical protein